MKKLFYIIPLLFGMALTSCYNDDIIDINNRLYDLEKDTRVATIQEQIVGIQNSLAALEDTDKELGEYITALEAEAESLEAKLAETNTKIDNVKNELSETISTEKANILAELEAFKATVNGELDAIKSVLETLKAKDVELEEQIADLKEYVDSEITATEDWATATFATLEQYEAVTTSIATIEGTIEGLNESLAALETRLGEKIAKDIETACATLSADLQEAVEDITTAYTSAIATAKQEITDAYTAAIKAAIATSEASMKEWVNEQLAGYYTIAEIDAKLEVLKATATDGDAALQKEIEALETSLAEQKTEITEAYTNAIAEAIATNNGVIDEKIAAEIEAVNERIDSEITALNKRLDDIEARLEELENAVTNLINRIQSITYVPTHDDGKARVDCHNASIEGSTMTMDFIISPKSAVADIAERFEEILTLKANFVGTTDFVSLPITSCTADAENGVLTISMTCDNLGEDFFYMRKNARVMLTISDGNNDRNTEYIALYPRYHKPADNMIVYTSTDGRPIDIEQQWKDIALNIYNGEIGLLISDNAITHIPYAAFLNCTSLASVIIPDSVTEIGESAFNGCTSLRSITIPNSVTSIGVGAFCECKRLMSLTIPESVTSIGRLAFFYGGMGELVINSKFIETNYDFDDGIFVDSGFTSIVIGDNVTRIGSYAFKSCLSLASITIPNSVTEIGERVFSGCTSLRSITIPNSVTSLAEGAFAGCPSLAEFNGKFASEDRRCLIIDRHLTKYAPAAELTEYTIPEGVTSIGNSAFSGCTSLTSVTIPEGVTSIGSEAFAFCPSLTSVTIPDSVTSIGGYAFYGCTSLTSFCGKFASEDGRYLIFGATLYHFAPAGLTEYTIPEGVISIGNCAFSGCPSLTSITIPDSVTTIEFGAFWNCTSLTSITIPDSVTWIGSEAFAFCPSLTSVYCKATTPPTGDLGMFYDNASGRKIYVPTESVEEYKAAEGWSEYRYSIVGYDFE